jgi:Flp pilus assembly protein CpaB
MLRSWRGRLPRIGKWPRLCAVGVCLLLALWSALGSKQGNPPRPVQVARVVVAARNLPAGHTIARGDLAVARWPATLRPASARADPRSLIGRRLAGPIDAREPLTPNRIVGRELTHGLAGGLAAVPVSLDDPHTADVVRAGNRVDVLATPRPMEFADSRAPTTGDPPVHTIASGALVLAVLPRIDDAAAELVLAVDSATAVRITRDRPGQVFTVLVQPP